MNRLLFTVTFVIEENDAGPIDVTPGYDTRRVSIDPRVLTLDKYDPGILRRLVLHECRSIAENLVIHIDNIYRPARAPYGSKTLERGSVVQLRKTFQNGPPRSKA